MERIINRDNIYLNIKNLLENENDKDRIVKQLSQYHFALRYPNIEELKAEKKELFEEIRNTYSKIAFYLLTRLTCFKYENDITLKGLSLAAFCFEIMAKNGDFSEEEVEESKLLSSICYSLVGNAANSIVMAKLIQAEGLYIFKQFLCRDFKNIIRTNYSEERIIENAIKKMSYSLIYKNDYSEEKLNNAAVIKRLKEQEDGNLYYFRFIILCFDKMILNSIRGINTRFANLKKYTDMLAQREKIYEFWESQKIISNQLEEIYNSNKISYISLPTSAGKTLLAELILYNYISIKQGVQLYIVPSLALENELRIKLGKRFKKVGIRVSNNIEYDEFGKCVLPQIVIATPEKIDLMIRKNADILNYINCVVFDEFHKVSNASRGWFEESLAIWMNILREQYDYKIVLISAIADELDNSLNLNAIEVFEDKWSPTRKVFCKFVLNANTPQNNCKIKRGETIEQQYDLVFNYPRTDAFRIKNIISQITVGKKNQDEKDSAKSETKADVMWKAILTIKERPLMVFFLNKKDIKSFINRTTEYLNEDYVNDERERLSLSLAQLLGEDHLLVKGIRRGVAFHDGDLPNDVRGIIESEFRKRTISILACTTTLADGVNLPAEAILMASIFPSRYSNNPNDLSLSDYKNIVGRIGRALYDTEGTVYLIDYPEFYYKKQELKKYYNGSEISWTLNSALDQIQVMNEEKLVNEEVMEQIDYESFKILLRLQLFFFTLFEMGIELDDFTNNIENYCLLNMNNKRKKIINGYGRYYYEKASSISCDFLRKNVKTGVSFNTNVRLLEIGERLIDKDKIFELITEDVYLELLNCPEFRPYKEDANHYGLFVSWISGHSFKTITQLLSDSEDKYEETTKYIKNVFQYIDPWMFGCLSEYLEEKPNSKKVIVSLSDQVKFGTLDDDVIELCRRGIKSRDLAIELANIFHDDYKKEDVFNWILNVPDEELLIRLADKFDVSILQQIGILKRENLEKSSYFEKVNRVICRIEITEDGEKRKDLVEKVKTGFIYLNHNRNNPINEFQIDVMCQNEKIGRLPNFISEEISEILDSDEILHCGFESEENGWVTIYIHKDSIFIS